MNWLVSIILITAIVYQDAVWSAPCVYKETLAPDSEFASLASRIDLEMAGIGHCFINWIRASNIHTIPQLGLLLRRNPNIYKDLFKMDINTIFYPQKIELIGPHFTLVFMDSNQFPGIGLCQIPGTNIRIDLYKRSKMLPSPPDIDKEYREELDRYKTVYGFISHEHRGYEAVRDILDRLLSAAGLDKDRFRFDIIQTHIPNAFVFPKNNHILLTTGLMELTMDYLKHQRKVVRVSSDEIAWVLAHEIGHIILGHYEEYAREEDYMFKGVSAKLLKKSFQHIFNLDMERKADIKALDIMDKAGFSVRASANFLSSLAWRQAKGFSDVEDIDKAILKMYLDVLIPDILHTHPNTHHRLALLRENIRNSYYHNYDKRFRYPDTSYIRGMCMEGRIRFRNSIDPEDLLTGEKKEISQRFWRLVEKAGTLREIEELLAIYPSLFWYEKVDVFEGNLEDMFIDSSGRIILFSSEILDFNPDKIPEEKKRLFQRFSDRYDRIVRKGLELYPAPDKEDSFCERMRSWLIFYSYSPNRTGQGYLKEALKLLDRPEDLLELLDNFPEKEFDFPNYIEGQGKGADYLNNYSYLKKGVIKMCIGILKEKGLLDNPGAVIALIVEFIKRGEDLEGIVSGYLDGSGYKKAGGLLEGFVNSDMFSKLNDEEKFDFFKYVFKSLKAKDIEQDVRLLRKYLPYIKKARDRDIIIWWVLGRYKFSEEAKREFLPLMAQPLKVFVGISKKRLEEILGVDYSKDPSIEEIEDALAILAERLRDIEEDYIDKDYWVPIEEKLRGFGYKKELGLKAGLTFRERVELAVRWLMPGRQLNDELDKIVSGYTPDCKDLEYIIRFYKVEDREEYISQVVKEGLEKAVDFVKEVKRCMRDYRYYKSIERPGDELRDIPLEEENSPLLGQKIRISRMIYEERKGESTGKGFSEKKALILEIFPDASIDRDRLLAELLKEPGISCDQYRESLLLFYSYITRQREALVLYKRMVEEDARFTSDFKLHLGLILELFPKFTPERDSVLGDLIDHYAVNEDYLNMVIPYLTEGETPKAKKEILTATAIEFTFRQYVRFIGPIAKVGLLLWLMRGGEKPYVVKVFESCSGYRLDRIRERKGNYYELFQRRFLEEMFSARNGVFTSFNKEGMEAQERFIRELSRIIVPDDTRLRLLLELIFREISITKKVEIATALTSSQVEGLGFEVIIKVFLQSFGVLGIKLGQYLATRTKAFVDKPGLRKELINLTDRASPFAKQEVFKMLRFIFQPGDFIEVGGRLGVASVKQVHRTVLAGRGDEFTVLKVMRPAAAKEILIDLGAIKRIVLYVIEHPDVFGINIPVDMIREIEESVLEELDFRLERVSQNRLRRNILRRWKARKGERYQVVIPGIMDRYTKGPVITEEGASGVPIRDYKGDDLSEIKGVLVRELIEEVFIDGFYHADPHPGNVFVSGDGIISVIDVGRAGRLSLLNKDLLFDLIGILIVEKDKEKLLRILAEFYLKTPKKERREIIYSDLVGGVGRIMDIMAGVRNEQGFIDAIKEIILVLGDIGIQLPREFYSLLRLLDNMAYLLEGTDVDLAGLIAGYMLRHRQDEGKKEIKRIHGRVIAGFLKELKRKRVKKEVTISAYIMEKVRNVKYLDTGTRFREISNRDNTYTLDTLTVIKPVRGSGFMDKSLLLRHDKKRDIVDVTLDNPEEVAMYEVYFEDTWVPLEYFLSRPPRRNGSGIAGIIPILFLILPFLNGCTSGFPNILLGIAFFSGIIAYLVYKGILFKSGYEERVLKMILEDNPGLRDYNFRLGRLLSRAGENRRVYRLISTQEGSHKLVLQFNPDGLLNNATIVISKNRDISLEAGRVEEINNHFRIRRRILIGAGLGIATLGTAIFGTLRLLKPPKQDAVPKDSGYKPKDKDYYESEALRLMEDLVNGIENSEFRYYAQLALDKYRERGILENTPADSSEGMRSLGDVILIFMYNPVDDTLMVNYQMFKLFPPITLQGFLIHEGRHIVDEDNLITRKKIEAGNYLYNKRSLTLFDSFGNPLRIEGTDTYAYQIILLYLYTFAHLEEGGYALQYEFLRSQLGDLRRYVGNFKVDPYYKALAEDMEEAAEQGTVEQWLSEHERQGVSIDLVRRQNQYAQIQSLLSRELNSAILEDGSFNPRGFRENFVMLARGLGDFFYKMWEAAMVIEMRVFNNARVLRDPVTGEVKKVIINKAGTFLDWLHTEDLLRIEVPPISGVQKLIVPLPIIGGKEDIPMEILMGKINELIATARDLLSLEAPERQGIVREALVRLIGDPAQDRLTQSMGWHVLEGMGLDEGSKGKVVYSLNALLEGDMNDGDNLGKLKALVERTRGRVFFYAGSGFKLDPDYEFLKESLITQDRIAELTRGDEILIFMLNEEHRVYLGVDMLSPGKLVENRFFVPIYSNRDIENDLLLGFELIRTNGAVGDLPSLFRLLLIEAIKDWLRANGREITEASIQGILQIEIPRPEPNLVKDIGDSYEHIRGALMSA